MLNFLHSLFSPKPGVSYDDLIHLDAEDLAETGIKKSYEKYVLPYLTRYVQNPVEITEVIDSDTGDYAVFAGDKHYIIYDDNEIRGYQDVYLAWGYATYAMFDIVNQQLVGSDYTFYAFNNGNDLSGMFLTQKEYKAYMLSASRHQKTDCPYIPTREPDWFGQLHD